MKLATFAQLQNVPIVLMPLSVPNPNRFRNSVKVRLKEGLMTWSVRPSPNMNAYYLRHYSRPSFFRCMDSKNICSKNVPFERHIWSWRQPINSNFLLIIASGSECPAGERERGREVLPFFELVHFLINSWYLQERRGRSPRSHAIEVHNIP